MTSQRGIQRHTERSQISRPESLPNTKPRFHYPTRTRVAVSGALTLRTNGPAYHQWKLTRGPSPTGEVSQYSGSFHSSLHVRQTIHPP